MSDDSYRGPPHSRWADLRFSVVGPLLTSPPPKGTLQDELNRLAKKMWKHPCTGELTSFDVKTIERWFYTARNNDQDPRGQLRRKIRSDAGTHRSITSALRQAIHAQHKQHRSWSYQLHHDNLVAHSTQDDTLGDVPSYSTILRFMQSQGLRKAPKHLRGNRPGILKAFERFEQRETRSFEAEYVNSLWHLDFHAGSLKVLTHEGEWVTPHLLGILDDYSRIACHLQWYLNETAENLIHGLCQAFQKRGLPRCLLDDNGAAMVADETHQGLKDLSIDSEHILPYCPNQNGKQEKFFDQVEGRLMAMLENVPDLTLSRLNEATLAWSEMEYNRTNHSEIQMHPVTRFIEGRDVGRQCPPLQTLNEAFTTVQTRRQRHGDGTVGILGVRFEIPSRYRHLKRVRVRFARWDLSHAYLADPTTDKPICRLFPLDKTRNADGQRRRIVETSEDTESQGTDDPNATEMAPLLRKLMADYAATGLPPAYVPKDDLQIDITQDEDS